MNPSTKVSLVQFIAEKLSHHSYNEIRFILEQFGLKESSEPSNNTYEFSINALKDAAPAKLIGLRSHFNSQSVRKENVDSSVWEDGTFRLFMSHITADKVLVANVKVELEKRGISAFVAHEDIKPTKKWEEEIEKALATCDSLAAFVTPNFHASNWTDQEVGYCIRRRILIIPLGLGATPYGFMGKYQGAQCKGLDAPNIAEKVFSILMEQPLSSAKLANALVHAFEQSSGYDTSRRLIQDLQKITTWTPDMLRRIEQAVEQNSQVSDAWNVPERVQTIITKNSF